MYYTNHFVFIEIDVLPNPFLQTLQAHANVEYEKSKKKDLILLLLLGKK